VLARIDNPGNVQGLGCFVGNEEAPALELRGCRCVNGSSPVTRRKFGSLLDTAGSGPRATVRPELFYAVRPARFGV
jgi:hypothetical protein